MKLVISPLRIVILIMTISIPFIGLGKNVNYPVFAENTTDRFFPETLILSLAEEDWLQSRLPEQFQDYQTELLYRKTTDGSTSAQFHNQCDNIPHTITIIKTSDGSILGGYHEGIWDATEGGFSSNMPNNFIYSITNQILARGFSYNNPTVMNHIDYGPSFGRNFLDINIDSDMNGGNSWSVTYRNFQEGYSEPQMDSDFVGSYDDWSILEIEVYALNTTGLDVSLIGCIDSQACNYLSSATCDDGSCIYAQDCDYCSDTTYGTGLVLEGDTDMDGICNTNEISGCLDPNSCNYNSSATEDNGLCLPYSDCTSCSGETDGSGTTLNDSDLDGVCDSEEVEGCQNPMASNYNHLATNSGECTFSENPCIVELMPETSLLNQEQQGILLSWLPEGYGFEAELLFDSAISGALASNFHEACDGTSNTIVVAVSAQGNVFGGYNEGTWSSDGLNEYDLNENFIFSFLHNKKYPAIPGKIHLSHSSSSGPNFGFWNSKSPLRFATNSSSGVVTTSYLGEGYECYENDENDCQLLVNNGVGWNGFTDRFYSASYQVWQLKTNGIPAGFSDIDNDAVCDFNEIFGCTDVTACNYDALATQNDGTCIQTPDGCTDTSAINYDISAICNDGSCIYVGCTNPEATNYNALALYDDGSCEGLPNCSCETYQVGALFENSDILSLNDDFWIAEQLPEQFMFESELLYSIDEGEMTVEEFHNSCDGASHTVVIGQTSTGYIFGGYNEGTWSSQNESISGLDNNFIFSVTNETIHPAIPGEVHLKNSPTSAPNFNDDLDFYDFYDLLVYTNLGNNYECVVGEYPDVVCSSHLGFEDEEFEFIRLEVWQLNTSGTYSGVSVDTNDNGICDSMEPRGCMDSSAINYNSTVAIESNTCIYSGCMNPLDENYNPLATYEDGSCFIQSVGCSGDFNGDGAVTIADLTGFLSAFGSVCE